MEVRQLGSEQALVLDKSYMRGASASQIKVACETFCAFMPEDLFFELISGDLATRTKCFRKFPRGENPVELLPNVGTLLRLEKESRVPSTPLASRCISMRFEFNAALASGDFELTEPQCQGVSQWRGDLNETLDSFIGRATKADRLFPTLRGLRPGQRPEVITELVDKIATDLEGVRQMYSAFAPTDFPPSSMVDESWAVFRRLQAHLIGAIEFFWRYGSGINMINRATLENEVADLNYLVVAVLAGGLATRDNTIARRFRLLCPRGTLVE